jgi:predicted transcriptional regulator of viral defense system
MFKLKVFKRLIEWDRKGKYVFTTKDLMEIFGDLSKNAFEKQLKSFVKAGVLVRAYRGVYVNPDAWCRDSYTIEHIAKAMRSSDFNYVSLESMLSEYGVISQIPVDRITVMTTGRAAEFKTTYGVIEFTKTTRDFYEVKEVIQEVEGRPLPIALKWAAYRDLKRIGRNLHLVDLDELNEDVLQNK